VLGTAYLSLVVWSVLSGMPRSSPRPLSEIDSPLSWHVTCSVEAASNVHVLRGFFCKWGFSKPPYKIPCLLFQNKPRQRCMGRRYKYHMELRTISGFLSRLVFVGLVRSDPPGRACFGVRLMCSQDFHGKTIAAARRIS